MKVNIEIDLSECYSAHYEYEEDCEATLSDDILSVIKDEVRLAISKQVREDVALVANEAYEKFGKEKIEILVAKETEDFIKNGKVRKSEWHPNSDMITVEERIKVEFESGNTWRTPYKAMEEIGKKFSDECRKKYDMSFASNIVTGLEKQGLLKEGVFESLVDKREL